MRMIYRDGPGLHYLSLKVGNIYVGCRYHIYAFSFGRTLGIGLYYLLLFNGQFRPLERRPLGCVKKI